jgi:hypothetical protein
LFFFFFIAWKFLFLLSSSFSCLVPCIYCLAFHIVVQLLHIVDFVFCLAPPCFCSYSLHCCLAPHIVVQFFTYCLVPCVATQPLVFLLGSSHCCLFLHMLFNYLQCYLTLHIVTQLLQICCSTLPHCCLTPTHVVVLRYLFYLVSMLIGSSYCT